MWLVGILNSRICLVYCRPNKLPELEIMSLAGVLSRMQDQSFLGCVLRLLLISKWRAIFLLVGWQKREEFVLSWGEEKNISRTQLICLFDVHTLKSSCKELGDFCLLLWVLYTALVAYSKGSSHFDKSFSFLFRKWLRKWGTWCCGMGTGELAPPIPPLAAHQLSHHPTSELLELVKGPFLQNHS